MRQLPLTKKHHGINYRLVRRGKIAGIYEQEVTPDISYYEVFVIRIKPSRIINGTFIEGTESFPSDEDFGKTPWSYRSWEEAERKYQTLEERINNNNN